MDVIREYVAREHVRPVVLNHLELSLTENETVGQLLAQLSILEPLETSLPNAEEVLPPPDEVKL